MEKKPKADAFMVEAAESCIAFLYANLKQAKKSAVRFGGGKTKIYPLFRGKEIKA